MSVNGIKARIPFTLDCLLEQKHWLTQPMIGASRMDLSNVRNNKFRTFNLVYQFVPLSLRQQKQQT